MTKEAKRGCLAIIIWSITFMLIGAICFDAGKLHYFAVTCIWLSIITLIITFGYMLMEYVGGD